MKLKDMAGSHEQASTVSPVGVKGGGRPDGVLRRPRLRRPLDHARAHLREPLQGEEVLLRSALRHIRDCWD